MALFGKKKTEEKVVEAKAKTVAKKPVKAKKDTAIVAKDTVSMPSSKKLNVIVRPHVTEKSGFMSEKSVYTFEILKNANKNAVAQSIKDLYKVIPVKIAIVNLPQKKVIHRGKRGYVSVTKKAVVTLKPQDKIEFV